jgi:hypothetical protein
VHEASFALAIQALTVLSAFLQVSKPGESGLYQHRGAIPSTSAPWCDPVPADNGCCEYVRSAFFKE